MIHLSPKWGPLDYSVVQLILCVGVSVCLSVNISVALSALVCGVNLRDP